MPGDRAPGAELREAPGAAGGRLRARRVLLATNAYTPLVRSIRRYVVPVYDYVLVTEPLSRGSSGAALGWRARAGRGRLRQPLPLLPAHRPRARILWGGYEAVYFFRNGMRPELEDHAPTFELLARNFAETFPQLEGIRFTHRWAGAIDTSSRFCVTFGTALGGRAAYAVGYTGPWRRRQPLRRACGARPPSRSRHRAHEPRPRSRAADPVPARAGPLRGDPGHPPRARSRRRARRAGAAPGCARWTGSARVSTASGRGRGTGRYGGGQVPCASPTSIEAVPLVIAPSSVLALTVAL